MKEHFEDRKLTGNIRISCKKDKKVVAVWETTKEGIIYHIKDAIAISNKDGIALSLRGLFYKLVARNAILNYLEAYKKLSKVVDDLKYSGTIDWESIRVDSARLMRLQYYAIDIEDALTDTISDYKLDRQEGQETHLEIWSEKDTLGDILSISANKYHIPLCINKGSDSSSAIYKGFCRFRQSLDETCNNIRILYVGDHDPTGIDMIRDIEERIGFMLSKKCTHDYKTIFKVIPVALTMTQVKQNNLPPNYAKEADNNLEKYIERFGTDQCWEVDALDNRILLNALDTIIENNIDMGTYNEVLERESQDIENLKSFINKE